MEGKIVSKNILNLSNRVRTPKKLDRYQIKKDLERLDIIRDVKLKMYYKTEPTPAFSEKPLFKVLSNWTPPIGDAELELYLSEIEDILLNLNESGKSYPNLTKDEREALHSLMYDDQIIIKPADKCSAVVAWSKDEPSNQLSDYSVYQKCEGNASKKVNNEVKSVLRDMFNRKGINNNVRDYLIMKKPQLGRFYLLPKIHKEIKVLMRK